jgi:hypothetical protein
MKIDVGAGLHTWKDDLGRGRAKLNTDDVACLISDIEDKCLEEV